MELDPILQASPPREIPLPNAPLERVVAQLRFPLIASVRTAEFIGPFQEAIRKTYPVLRQELVQGFALSPQGLTPAVPQVVWRFSDHSNLWRISLASEFLAVEALRYTSRADFIGRLRFVLEALKRYIDPGTTDRLGIRFVDRIVGDNVARIESLVRPEIRGIVGSSISRHATSSITETIFEVSGSNAKLLSRWGKLPAGTVVDPAIMDAISEPSWILDIDMFRDGSTPFDVDSIVDEATLFAERIYTFFRWAVTVDFLKAFGADAGDILRELP